MVNGVGSINHFRKKLTHTHEFISTAHHEAGHVIYGLLHFMKIFSVSIVQNKKTKRIDGFTHYDVLFQERVKDPVIIRNIILSEIGICYAGLSAEKILFKIFSGSDKFPMFLKDGSSDDTLAASELIRKFAVATPGKQRYAFKQTMIKNTLSELQEYWDDVALVAHALFQKKKLSYIELQELLIKKSINKKYWKQQFKKLDIIYDNTLVIDDEELKHIMGL